MPLVFNRIYHTTTEILDRKLLKSAMIHCSKAQWYLVCTKVVRRIRAVQFWIIYYWSALSEPSYYVLVKHHIFYFPGEGAAPAGFTVLNANVSSATKRLWLTSSVLWHVRVRSVGTTYFSENYFNAMFSFYWISVLLISVTFYTYLANIIFWCNLAFKVTSAFYRTGITCL